MKYETSLSDRYRVRPVDLKDVVQIFRWRNDPVTREASFDTSEKTQDSFASAFRNWCEQDPIPPHLVEFEGENVAFLRFSVPHKTAHTDDKTIEISIHVAPEVRRRGHAKASLAYVEHLAKDAGWLRILALVKPSNEVSRRLFKAAGYGDCGQIELDSTDRASGGPAKIYLRVLAP